MDQSGEEGNSYEDRKATFGKPAFAGPSRGRDTEQTDADALPGVPPPPNLAHSPAGISGESSILVTRPLSKFFRQLGEC